MHAPRTALASFPHSGNTWVREPFDALLSFHRWTVAVPGRRIPWAAFAPHGLQAHGLQECVAHTRRWLAAPKPRVALRHEGLRRDPVEGCRRIARFRGFALVRPGSRRRRPTDVGGRGAC